MKIIEAESMVEQFRLPKSKKRRIRNKWKKRPQNFRPSKKIIVDEINGVYYCHPEMARRLRAELKTTRPSYEFTPNILTNRFY